MADLTQLFNAAFAAIGDEVPIGNAQTDDSRKAVIARVRWPIIRDGLLRSHKWNCAIRRAVLAPDAEAPAWGFESYFTLPHTPYCLRLLEIEDYNEDYQIEGRKVGANVLELKIKFIARIGVDEFDAMLLDVAVDALGAELAVPLGAGPDVRKSLYEGVYAPGGKLTWARSIDGQEGQSRINRNRSIIDTRRRFVHSGPPWW